MEKKYVGLKKYTTTGDDGGDKYHLRHLILAVEEPGGMVVDMAKGNTKKWENGKQR